MLKNYPKSCSGHGTFIYNAAASIERYGTIELVAQAINSMGMQHAWIRIHGARAIHTEPETSDLIAALREAGIGVAGWGWCQGESPADEATRAVEALTKFELTEYVADIEEGVNNSFWSDLEIDEFFSAFRSQLGSNVSIVLSTHGFIDWHVPELMQVADPYIDFFAPQVYWFWYPSNKMLKAVALNESGYPLNNPVSYANLCIDRWRQLTQKPIVITGQAYWGEHPDYSRLLSEEKLDYFVANFSRWEDVAGINWWHLGGKGQNAMSYAMYQSISMASLQKKFLY